jgi:hypothetical protein
MLNDNQRRRVGTYLGLLREDLASLRRWSGPVAGTVVGRRIGEVVEQLEAEIETVYRTFGLQSNEPTPLRRRMAAIAEVWRGRVEDLRARQLESHGAVDPDLPAALDPHVDRLEDLLRDLARAAAQIPET